MGHSNTTWSAEAEFQMYFQFRTTELYECWAHVGWGQARENGKEEIYTVGAYEFKRLSGRPHRTVIVPVTGFIIKSHGTNLEGLCGTRPMKCTGGLTVIVYIPLLKTNFSGTCNSDHNGLCRMSLRPKWAGGANFPVRGSVFISQSAAAMHSEESASLARLAEVPVGCDRLWQWEVFLWLKTLKLEHSQLGSSDGTPGYPGST